ncbi:MAG: hypothetical protein A2268_09715 [Candidatus Raymondbacteria bacterium RifOxyA12_full_50_37]|uniref:Uncharacterized protein n=1 Tax=Candidatus Raymondbacteria bacterium RIFOXYD12_FULL_49_13 TaxID=1817890 RepID=A0A1F7F1H9_UNCRA|nr:MAG: hypothetical protein A2268_09715 [Candidatus Raymondbacteria bacterium RifOxyA12_full_50_37]OGJ93883.1 MAG: hypothetical protein A2248_06580 [Candidatus Raymondbacteria bacterium RIFOXYA2_FULL_49_16]OGJ98248.1 MAG: hypothetical protein A2453_00585 [Candidatus Raymondbacteria bacterium RIFOXYC2_FULL_50_21]OGK00481.1 MAG: hypothetical protein A2519_10760 [Candidatus Raymondbacteria bacterium RIFOXYD12_FULL_49_13]OGK03867.1 MAG: hypothetical protein A2350_13500 [Candidatus Raymondbacteria 
MAQQVTQEQAGWALVRIWLTAMEKTARDFHGMRPKKFCMRSYEHATEDYLRLMDDEFGITIKKAKSIREAIQNYIEFSVRAGLLKDASQVEITEINPNSVEIKVMVCPYMKSCKDLMDEDVGVKDLTCARIGCFRAAVLILANIDCTYETISVDLVNGCQGIVERI